MKHEITLRESIKVTDYVSTTKEYYKRHPRIIVANIFIMLVASLIGLVITGGPGVIVGFVIGILAFLFLPPAIIKIKEIRNH
ncbi:MAG: hypothetical protein WC505_04385 [Patescibacteria group bacterium]